MVFGGQLWPPSRFNFPWESWMVKFIGQLRFMVII
jgi:hypothetical protein